MRHILRMFTNDGICKPTSFELVSLLHFVWVVAGIIRTIGAIGR
jgi:hypothetical protein